MLFSVFTCRKSIFNIDRPAEFLSDKSRALVVQSDRALASEAEDPGSSPGESATFAHNLGFQSTKIIIFILKWTLRWARLLVSGVFGRDVLKKNQGKRL